MAIFLVLLLVITSAVANGGDRPHVDEVPQFARWLVSKGKWGVLCTLNAATVPFGYIASYSDAGTGYPYFFLSSLDPAGKDALTDARASFTLTELSIDDCGGSDPQSPTCPKITLTGQLRMLPGDSDEGGRAERALFEAHPAFTRFPKQNGTFAVYKLDIEEIFLVNKAGPRRELTVEDYLDVE